MSRQRKLYHHLTNNSFLIERVDKHCENVQRDLLHFMLLNHKRKAQYLYKLKDEVMKAFLTVEWNKVKQH
jgi:hypothetical protein